MNMKRITSILLIMLMLFSLAACGSSEEATKDEPKDVVEESKADEETTAAEKEEAEESVAEEGEAADEEPVEDQDDEKKIGFSNFASIQYFMDIAASIKHTADKHGYSVIELRHEGDFSKRLSQIEDLVSQGCKIIITELGESGSLSEYFEELKEQGIIIVCIDVPTEPNDYWIASDDKEIGATSAETVVEYLTEKNGSAKGTVAMLSSKTVTSMRDRCDGFREYMEDYPEIEIVDERFPTEFDTSLMMTLTEDILQLYPTDTLDVIFASNQTQLEGSNAAVTSNERQDVAVFGVDDSEAIREALQDPDSTVMSTIVQDPIKMGEVAVETALEIAAGNVPEEKIYHPPVLAVTRDNVEEFIAEANEMHEKLKDFY